MSRKRLDCSCGRTAEWVGAISGQPECWELIDQRRHENDKTEIWQYKYPGQEARHGTPNGVGKDEA